MPRSDHPPGSAASIQTGHRADGRQGHVELMQNVNSSADDGHIAQDGARGHVALA